MPATRSGERPGAERASAPQPVEVEFVRSGRSAGGAIQEWRSQATGRVHEVPAGQSYAPAAILEEGATGWLMYAGGVPWVGETKDEALRMTRRVPERLPPLRGAPSSTATRGARVPWTLIFVLALIVAIVWAMVQ